MLTQQLITANVIREPSQIQMNQYLKKVFIEVFDSNQHVDDVRKNYIKRINKKNNPSNQSNTRNSIQLEESSYFLNCSSVKPGGINSYLRQLEEDAKKNNLPEEIKTNKLLCSLYQKLDVFENNLIAEQEKQKIYQNTNDEVLRLQMELPSSEIQFRKKVEINFQKAKIRLQQKEEELQRVKEKLLAQKCESETAKYHVLPEGYIKSLIEQTSSNLKKTKDRIIKMQQSYIKLKSSQVQNIRFRKQVQEISTELRSMVCELYRQKELFR